MQKVEGSSPFSRLSEWPRFAGLSAYGGNEVRAALLTAVWRGAVLAPRHGVPLRAHLDGEVPVVEPE